MSEKTSWRSHWSFHVCDTCQATLKAALKKKVAQHWGCCASTEQNEQTAEAICASARDGCLICAYLGRLGREKLRERNQRSPQLAAFGDHRSPPTIADEQATRAQESIEHQHDEKRPTQARKPLSTLESPHVPTVEELDSLLTRPNISRGTHYLDATDNPSVLRFRFYPPQPDAFWDGFTLKISVTLFGESMFEELGITDWTLLNTLGLASMKQAYTGSDECLRLAKQWFDCCANTHTVCNQDESPHWYPTRLLALQDRITTLIHPKDSAPTGRYACLSYCWGDDHSETLTHETLTRWQAGVPFEQLQAAFRDAMLFVQSLGIDYIWIDRFCILQGDDTDSALDWDRESQQMHQIFGNAVLTVVATHASTPADGCFVTRALVETKNYALMDTQLDEASGSKTFKVNHRHGDWTNPSGSWSAQDATLRRAWCLQERTFSHRSVIFGTHGIGWRCAQGPDPTEDRPKFYEPGNRNIRPIALTQSRLAGLSKDDVYEFWYSLLTSFSRRDLSRPVRDKLRAIHGVAQCVSARLNDGYLYGHFVFSMPRSLCWTSLDLETERSLSRPSERIMPSWSWAATDGPKVCYPVLRTRQRSKVSAMSLATMIFPRHVDDLEEVQLDRRMVILLGRLLPVRITRNDDVTVVGTSTWRVYGAMFDLRSEQEYYWRTQSWLYILPIEWLRDESIIEPYLMLLVTKRHNGNFRRVGVVQLSYSNHATTAGFRQDRSARVEQGVSYVGAERRQIMSRAWHEQYQRTKPALVILS